MGLRQNVNDIEIYNSKKRKSSLNTTWTRSIYATFIRFCEKRMARIFSKNREHQNRVRSKRIGPDNSNLNCMHIVNRITMNWIGDTFPERENGTKFCVSYGTVFEYLRFHERKANINTNDKLQYTPYIMYYGIHIYMYLGAQIRKWHSDYCVT